MPLGGHLTSAYLSITFARLLYTTNRVRHHCAIFIANARSERPYESPKDTARCFFTGVDAFFGTAKETVPMELVTIKE